MTVCQRDISSSGIVVKVRDGISGADYNAVDGEVDRCPCIPIKPLQSFVGKSPVVNRMAYIALKFLYLVCQRILERAC